MGASAVVSVMIGGMRMAWEQCVEPGGDTEASCPGERTRLMATKFGVEERWPELFSQLDDTQRRAVVQSLASPWHEGWDPNREDIDDAEYLRRVDAAAERRRAAAER